MAFPGANPRAGLDSMLRLGKPMGGTTSATAASVAASGLAAPADRGSSPTRTTTRSDPNSSVRAQPTAALPARPADDVHALAGASHTVRNELVAGAIAGASSIWVGYPLDTVKVRLQASPGTYRGTLDCLRKVVRADGVRGLFRGVTSPVMGGAFETGVNYLVYSRLLSQLRDQQGYSSAAAVPLSGAAAGLALSGVLGPIELVKCRMQQGSPSVAGGGGGGGIRYPTPLACLKHVVRTEGWRGLTRGLGCTVARETPANAIFFAVYESLRSVVPRRLGPSAQAHASGSSPGTSDVIAEAASAIVCGGIAGSVMWAAVLPLDVAKTRKQTALPGTKWDVGLWQHLRMMWSEGRWRALFAGLTPTVMRAFPANSAQWVAWELCMHALQGSETSAAAASAGAGAAAGGGVHADHYAPHHTS